MCGEVDDPGLAAIRIPFIESKGSAWHFEACVVTDSQAARRDTILLVEDDLIIRKMAQEYLTAKGFFVLVAGSGEEAIRVAELEPAPIDILVSDITLPGESGRTVAGNLSKRIPSLRILFISGYAQDAEIFQGALSAGVDFLQKPFGLDILVRKIRDVLDRPPA
jgi:two-component system cell cycle sensor histidine kinase/response regulator CckA